LSRGEAVTPDAVQLLIARADHDKVDRAHERLTAMTTKREP
jgi:hypothetical protein